jgi:hypothetical protein
MKIGAACALACVFFCANAGATDADLELRRLQIEQQRDALNLELQQSLPSRRSDLDPADVRRLEALRLQQRMQYQLVEQDQLHRSRTLRHNPVLSDDAKDRRLSVQRELFAQERQLMIQRFELDQHRLLQSAPRQPLQRTPGTGQLRLR